MALFSKMILKIMNAKMKAAKRDALARYDGECVVTLQRNPVACHIYGAGAYPELKYEPLNIVPLVPEIHTTASKTFDWVEFGKEARQPVSKIEWLYEYVHPDHSQKIKEQIADLMELIVIRGNR